MGEKQALQRKYKRTEDNLTGLLFKFFHRCSTCSTSCLIGADNHSNNLPQVRNQAGELIYSTLTNIQIYKTKFRPTENL